MGFAVFARFLFLISAEFPKQDFFEKLKNFYLTNKETLDNWNVPNTGKEQTLLNFHLKEEKIY